MSDVIIDKDALLSLMAGAALTRFKDKMEGWQSPINGIVEDAFKIHSDAIRAAVYKATGDCVNSGDFQQKLTDQLNHKLANLIINKCSGLVEKSFNNLMQDAVLRTKLQSAVIAIIEKEAP